MCQHCLIDVELNDNYTDNEGKDIVLREFGEDNAGTAEDQPTFNPHDQLTKYNNVITDNR